MGAGILLHLLSPVEPHVWRLVLTVSCLLQVYKPGAGLAFHFDKDEALFKQQSVMHHPKSSAVLYLYGDAEKQSLGAPCSGSVAVILVWPLAKSWGKPSVHCRAHSDCRPAVRQHEEAAAARGAPKDHHCPASS